MILLSKVKQLWPDRVEEVLALLDEYTGVDPERVRLAAVKLSGGSVDALRQAIVAARTDFRDVVAWAEAPRSMKAGASPSHPTAEQRRACAENARKDRQEYEDWLRLGEGPELTSRKGS